MIRVAGLTHHYGLQPVLSDIDLHVRAGEVIAVMGPNGVGKSTLLQIIAGLLPPLRGRVEIDGHCRWGSEADELHIRRKLVYLPDEPWFPSLRSGREYILAVGRLYGIDEIRLVDHTQRLLALFNLENIADAAVRTYSTGQRKKIGLSAALVAETPIMILDEPFSGGLDPSGLLAIRTVLKRLAEGDDKTIIIASPVAELVEGLADRVAIVKEGRLVAYDTAEALRRQTNCHRFASGDSGNDHQSQNG